MATFGPRPRKWGAVAWITVYALLACAALAALAASGIDAVAVVVVATAAIAVLLLLLARTNARFSSVARRMASETALMADANPAHRLDRLGAGELHLLAAAVNQLADRRDAAEREMAHHVEAARRDMEAERNRLAALMAQLTVAVIVCNTEGRILLYNEAARAVVGGEAHVGLGRSVFGVIDRGLITHAYDRLASGSAPVHASTTLRSGRLLQVRVALVREPVPGSSSGFVLVLEDLTQQVRANDRRERLLRKLTEATRASLGSMRAAVESVLEFPDLSPAERSRFLEIVREESDRLGRRVDEWAVEAAELGGDRVLTDIAGGDLLAVLARELQRADIEVNTTAPPDALWIRADSHALARALVHIVSRLHELLDVQKLSLSLTGAGRHGQLDVRWKGDVPPSATFEGWLGENLDGGPAATVRDVADRHGAELWCGDAGGSAAYVRMLLPQASSEQHRPVVPPTPVVASRPEFYDFDLFAARPQTPEWESRRLDELSFTVLDTETTGLDPTGGDRIVAIGAVRVVNGRLLRQETFERLVQPHRPVPRAATAIHGITTEMLSDAPTIAEVLPAFVRFAEDTVLVGHNVGFDLKFLKLAEPSAGVHLTQPALDTLLLDAALHPDHDDHTLEAIAQRLGVSVVGRHTALGDALVTGEVLLGLLALLRRRGVATLGEALEAARETYHARVDERLYGA